MSDFDSESVAQDQLQSFVRRIESLEDEINALNGDKSEVYKEAKGNGFDTKVLRRVIADRRKDATERNEFDAVYQLYWDAIHGVVRAHVENIEEIAAEARAKRSAALDRLAAMDADIIDADTGEILNEHPMSHASGQPGGDDPELQDDAASSGETAPNNERSGGALEARLSPKQEVAGSSPAQITKSQPVVGADEAQAPYHGDDAGRDSSAGTEGDEDRQPHSEAADLATVTVAETALVPRVAAASEPIADISKPNPICRDPGDCGVYASWHLTCEACKRASAHRVAA